MLVGAAIISCSIFQDGDVTAVLFGTAIIRAAFFGTVISVRCYSVRLLFLQRSLVG